MANPNHKYKPSTKRKTFKYNKKTGMKQRIDPKRSRIARKAAMKRKGKHLKSNVRMKISKSLKKVRRMKRTLSGRRVKFAPKQARTMQAM